MEIENTQAQEQDVADLAMQIATEEGAAETSAGSGPVDLMFDALNRQVEAHNREDSQEEAQEQEAEEAEEEGQEEGAEEEAENNDESEVVNESEETEEVAFGDDFDEFLSGDQKPDEFGQKFSEQFKDLGIEAKNLTEFKAAISELKRKAEEAEGAVEMAFANDLLKEANELAKNNGDWQEYLGVSSIDYNAVPDDSLIMWEEQGSFESKEELEEYVSNLDDKTKELLAKKIRTRLVAEQTSKKQELVDRAQKYQEQYDQNLNSSISKLEKVSDFKVNDPIKAELRKALTSYDDKAKATEFQKMFFLNEKGEPDFDKLTQSAVKLMMFDKVVEYAKSKAANSVKKQVLQETSNVTKPVGKVTSAPTPQKALSVYEENLQALMRGEKSLF